MTAQQRNTMTDFASLHNHSHYSILSALSSPEDILKRAKELGQPAIAITDHSSLAAAWQAYNAAKKLDIKLIIGCEMYFVNDTTTGKDDRFRHIILLAKNQVGYQNLLALSKSGYDHSTIFHKRVYPLIDWKALEMFHEGLICLTSCSNGILAQLLMQKKHQEAEEQLQRLMTIFGDDLGLEVQPNTLKRGSVLHDDYQDQVFVNAALIKLGAKYNVRVVATTNSHYINKEDADIHDTMLAVGSHSPKRSGFRLKYNCPEFYIKTGDEVKSFFERNYKEKAAEFVANSIYFADKCEEPVWIDPKYSNPTGKELPVFPCQDEPDYQEFLKWQKTRAKKITDLEEDKQFLRYRCELTFFDKAPKDKVAEYRARLEEELDVLYYCGISSYMLIVADYVAWARKNGISVGPGRGSAGGCLVAWLLNIHQADPIKYGLVFARFYNKLKGGMSDIDMDFAQSSRERVIEYIVAKYGRDNVAQISNFVAMTPKVYVRDIARACDLTNGTATSVDVGTSIADAIPAEVKSMDAAYRTLPLFVEYAKKYPEVMKYSAIANKPRNTSLHAAGVVISHRPLHNIVPTRRDKDGVYVIEYDKDMAEENGLVKMDILGLSTLDIIDATNRLIAEAGKEVPSVDYEAYDQATYDLISSGNTFGVFQFGTSGGTIDLCKQIKPKSIEDLALITTLARPAAKDIRKSFIKTRNGQSRVRLIDPSLERAFASTLGYPLYDESLLVLAKDVAGWDYDEADKLRKLTKEKGKHPEKVAKWREEFIQGAIKNDVIEERATKIWDDIVAKFGSYSFNLSHAVLYSMISFHTAYLKAHFPIEFLMANLFDEIKSNSPKSAANIAKIKSEIRAHNVPILPPDINNSELRYTLKEGKLITGLDAIKFVSDDAINDIIAKRPFTSFQDFLIRTDSRKVRANTIQALTSAGCLDWCNIPRHQLFLYCSDYRKKLTVWMKKHDLTTEQFIYPFPKDKAWNIVHTYAMEFRYLGEGFSCKPAIAYGKFFADAKILIKDIKTYPDKTSLPSVKCIVKDFFAFRVKKEGSKYLGMMMVKAMIEDANGDSCSLTIFPDRWEQVQGRLKTLNGKDELESGMALHFGGSLNMYEGEVGIILDKLFDIKPIPQCPTKDELKARRVSMRLPKKATKEPKTATEIAEAIEDELVIEGLIDDEDIDEHT